MFYEELKLRVYEKKGDEMRFVGEIPMTKKNRRGDIHELTFQPDTLMINYRFEFCLEPAIQNAVVVQEMYNILVTCVDHLGKRTSGIKTYSSL